MPMMLNRRCGGDSGESSAKSAAISATSWSIVMLRRPASASSRAWASGERSSVTVVATSVRDRRCGRQGLALLDPSSVRLGATRPDSFGRDAGVTHAKGATVLTSEAVARDLSGRVIDRTVDGIDAGYDTGAAMVSGTAAARRVMYPLSGGLAANINDNGAQLFDAAVAWASGKSPKIAYKRDATDRITERTVNARVVARYSYTASGDTSDLTLDGSNNVIEATIALPGGAMCAGGRSRLLESAACRRTWQRP